MDPLFKPLNTNEKAELDKRGYKEWEYMSMNRWTDPDSNTYHLSSAVILAISLYGRHFARKMGQPAGLFTLNIIMIPLFYFASFKYKHVDQIFTNYRPRPTFNECLEFYPVTRRAFKKALIIREQEMEQIKSTVGEITQ